MTDLAAELLGPARAVQCVAPAPPKTWTGVGCPISFTILGQPCSKANSRQLAYPFVKEGEAKRMIFRKSGEAIAYERDALRQIPPAFRLRLEGPLAVTMRLWYRTEQPDLDASIVLDVMQDRWDKAHGPLKGDKGRVLLQPGVYRNDRQVRELHLYHGIDRANPRAEITVQTLVSQQGALL